MGIDRASFWLDAVRLAPSEEALVGVLRDYLAAWPSEELRLIPERCRPGVIDGREAILEFAVMLAREDLKFDGDASAAEALREMAAVFAEGSARLPRMVEDKD